MIRQTLVYAYVFGFGLYAFKDWYKSLCALILMMAAVRHPDMPRTLLGIQGLSPWNMLLIFVILGCLAAKSKEGLKWDMPSMITKLLVAYFLLIIIGFIRMIMDTGGIVDYALLRGRMPPGKVSLISEYLINPIKWTIPGMLLFYGCNSRERVKLACFSIVGLYFLLAVQIIRWMPFSALAGGEALDRRAVKILSNEIGMHRVTLSMMMAGAFWAAILLRNVAKDALQRFLVTIASFTILFAQALTGGRAGYVAWAATGMTISFLRFKKYLVLIPIFACLIIFLVPAVSERFLGGVGSSSEDAYRERLGGAFVVAGVDLYKMTSGRIVAWPYVLDEVAEAPIFGHGRLAMQRTGLSRYLLENLYESFPHPHNAYLQWLLDNGLLGFVIIILFYALMMKFSFSLLKDSRDILFVVTGGIAFSLLTAYLVAGIGSQYFYPVEESVGRWAAIGLMLRMYVERSNASEVVFETDETKNKNKWKEL